MAQDRRHAKDVNFVHQDAIHNETVKKENRSFQPYTNFNINPYTPMYAVTGKPNSLLDASANQDKEDVVMRELISMAQKPPTEKYVQPQTSSQEYGWISTPLLELDRSDVRLYHPRRMTDVTETKEVEWKLTEQSQKPH